MPTVRLVVMFLSAWTLYGATPLAFAAADKKEHSAEMETAIATFGRKDYPKAEKQFRALLDRDLPAATAGKVTFNLGITLKMEKKYSEAIKVFHSILTSKVDDREPGENLMEEFMNYRYRSCLQIASCYVQKKDYASALAAVELARDKYKYEAHCGTCAQNAKERLESQLAALRAEMSK